MAVKAPKGAKRELLDVEVKFVSLVRRPANKRAFALVKSADNPAEVIYKSEDWPDKTKNEPGPIGKLFSLMLKTFGRGKESLARTGDEAGEVLEEALADINGLGDEIGDAFKEAEMAVDQKKIDGLKKEAAELAKKIEALEGEKQVDALEGLSEKSKASEVVKRLGQVLTKLEGEIAKAGTEKEGKLQKLMSSIAAKGHGILKAIPEEFRLGAFGDAAAPAKTGAAKGSAGPGEHIDQTVTGEFGEAMDPETEAKIKARFEDLIKETKEAHAKEIKALKEKLDTLMKKAGRSTIDDPESASGEEVEEDTEKGKRSPWAEDMSEGLDGTDLVAARKEREEEDFGVDSGSED